MFDQMIASGQPSYLLTSRRVRALIRLGQAQLKAGEAAKARATAEEALAAERPIEARIGNAGNEEHAVLVHALILDGKANMALGSDERAEILFREARERAQRIAQSEELMDAIPLANVDQALGDFYIHRHQLGESRACYQELLGLWQRFSPANEYVGRQKSLSMQLASLR